MAAFAGPAKNPPAYALWLMEQYGSTPVLHLEENKDPIGKDEAGTLLDMKLQRGGMDRLQTLQQTIRALLGVAVDAFQANTRGAERTAEMDVDNFLVEANGAGVRESLRLILDLELKKPSLLLLEEPEVHLHPGLARVIATYLREKSREIQMFVTTHSTEFVDSVAFQNAYMVSRDEQYKTVCQSITESDGPLLLPSELGLRLSTVFMFDRLLFVEGPSDEVVLRTLAKALKLDLTKSNIGFVHMCGIRNFAHFAAEGTLDLLSRRKIEMWFIADRDERNEEEVRKMEARLGPRAKLKVLERRELENYLLDEAAIRKLIEGKRKPKPDAPPLTAQSIAEALRDASTQLRPEVVRLRLERRLLTPIFLNVRTMRGSTEERLKGAAELIKQRLDTIESEKAKIEEELQGQWAAHALEVVPGTLLLEQTAVRLGASYTKEAGDSERLARYMNPDDIPKELKDLLAEVTRE
jgi:putative ATP-dependent endonuclease of the OLD family